MEEALDIKSSAMFDDSIAHYEIHSHRPYATSSYQSNDTIHITIQHQDQLLLPSKSFIHIQGKIRLAAGGNVVNTKLVNNAICHLFSEIKYELNGQLIDRCNNVGISTLMKGYPSYTPVQQKFLENAGWIFDNE